MPGLVGVVGDGHEVDREVVLGRMCGALRGKRSLEVRTYVGPGIALGRVALGIFGRGPTVSKRDESFCLAIDGEVYVDGGAEADAESVTDVLVEDAKRGVQRLRGSFVVVLWDGGRKTLVVVNDRYGLRPMYYCLWEGRLLFASEVKAILAYLSFAGKVDERGVSDLLCFGLTLENRTLFEGITVLPAGTILKYCDGKISLEKYWDFTFVEAEEDRSEEAYEADFADLLMQAVRRGVIGDDRIGVCLSGGLDSRTIAAGAVRAREGIHTFTFGEQDSPDGRIALKVADRLGTAHHFFEIGPEDLIEGAEEAVWLSDGMLNWRHTHGLSVFPRMRAYADVVLVGMQLLGSFLSRRFQRCDDDEVLLRCLFDPLGVEQRRRLCSGDFFEQTEEGISASSEELKRSAAHLSSPIDRWDYWDLTQRQRRFIAMGQVLMRNHVETRCPLFDYDLVDFVLGVPDRLRVNQHLYVRAFCRLFPELAKIPWERTGLPVRAAWWRVRLRQMGRAMVDRGFGYPGRRFRGGSLGNIGAWYRAGGPFRSFVCDLLLSRRARQRGYFNGAAVERFLEDPGDDLEVVGRLVTLELGWRLFFNE